MIITGKRLRKIDRYLPHAAKGKPIVLGVPTSQLSPVFVRRIGFPDLQAGTSVLPATIFGKISYFNANGGYIIHKDRPKETAYRQAEWHWTEWHGRDEEERSEIVDVPYQRYPRTFVPPPALELTIQNATDGSEVIVLPSIPYDNEHKDQLLHACNLLLEIFGECHVYTDGLDRLIRAPSRRLNWDILPPGKHPWPRLQSKIKDVLDDLGEGKRPVIEHRLELINDHQPEFVAIGRAGFHGYLVFGFPSKGVHVLESAFTGNATYVFGDDWEELSKLTKAEILTGQLQQDRIIHRAGWDARVRNLLASS